MRLCLLTKGNLEQTGSVAEVFQRPENIRVGIFVGMSNIMRCTLHDSVAHLAGIPLGSKQALVGAEIGLRPEDIKVHRENTFTPGYCGGRGTLTTLTQQGFGCEMTIESGGATLLVHADKGSLNGNGLIIGGEVFIGFHPDALHICSNTEKAA